jgi:hypothetical protein
MDLHLVKADRTKKSDGVSKIEALDNKTVFSVVTFIDPGSPLAHLIRGRAIKQATDAAESFVKQVEAEKASQQDLLSAQVERLRAALAPAER